MLGQGCFFFKSSIQRIDVFFKKTRKGRKVSTKNKPTWTQKKNKKKQGFGNSAVFVRIILLLVFRKQEYNLQLTKKHLIQTTYGSVCVNQILPLLAIASYIDLWGLSFRHEPTSNFMYPPSEPITYPTSPQKKRKKSSTRLKSAGLA